MALIENLSRFGYTANTWINLSGGAGSDTVTSLSATSRTDAPQGITVRVVLPDGTLVPVMNSRLLAANQSVRIRLPGMFLGPGQYLSCYSSDTVEWNMTLARVNGGRPRTNRINAAPPVGAWHAISPPGYPMEITSVLCVNKTEAEARVGLRFRNDSDGGFACLFLDERVPPRSTYRASIPNYLIPATQWLDVFSTADCAWFISGVTA
ncbi:hypothetical protein GCM10007242_44770 [Pigmentiphaga litoralis]|uniref:hypothetical protein n=1 Tax=Pigmentiphaga litoralis TaxID=516702 RepID=UPI001679894B|nr:hypothetical protein [Pigmentiphaga litoralis]GGX32847.1 hypothetical protein GCM10007242_44770 [Pigmentiphaga litoralis]